MKEIPPNSVITNSRIVLASNEKKVRCQWLLSVNVLRMYDRRLYTKVYCRSDSCKLFPLLGQSHQNTNGRATRWTEADSYKCVCDHLVNNSVITNHYNERQSLTASARWATNRDNGTIMKTWFPRGHLSQHLHGDSSALLKEAVNCSTKSAPTSLHCKAFSGHLPDTHGDRCWGSSPVGYRILVCIHDIGRRCPEESRCRLER